MVNPSMVPTNRKMNESAMSYYSRIIFCLLVEYKKLYFVQLIFCCICDDETRYVNKDFYLQKVETQNLFILEQGKSMTKFFFKSVT